MTQKGPEGSSKVTETTKKIDQNKDLPGFKGKDLYQIRNKIAAINKPSATKLFDVWYKIQQLKLKTQSNHSDYLKVYSQGDGNGFSGEYQAFQGNYLSFVADFTTEEQHNRIKMWLKDDGSIGIFYDNLWDAPEFKELTGVGVTAVRGHEDELSDYDALHWLGMIYDSLIYFEGQLEKN